MLSSPYVRLLRLSGAATALASRGGRAAATARPRAPRSPGRSGGFRPGCPAAAARCATSVRCCLRGRTAGDRRSTRRAAVARTGAPARRDPRRTTSPDGRRASESPTWAANCSRIPGSGSMRSTIWLGSAGLRSGRKAKPGPGAETAAPRSPCPAAPCRRAGRSAPRPSASCRSRSAARRRSRSANPFATPSTSV